MSVYLDEPRSGVAWLLDPESAELQALARAAHERTPETPCDGRALADDADTLRDLIAERHFGVSSGRVAAPALDGWDPSAARTWGEAVTDLQDELRAALRDEHVRIVGAPPRPLLDGPGFEEREIDGVLVLRIRRLMGEPDDERAFAAWVADADRHFAYDRIVVDLRGNGGGNDGHTFRWAQRRFRHVPGFVRSAGWSVRGVPLGNWNAAAWWQARTGVDGVPPSLLSGRHDPRPDDVLEVVDEEYALDPGGLEWDGRMLVLTDRDSRSSGESSAWLLRQGLGARIAGERSGGMIEYGNIVTYVLPSSGLAIQLPTKSNDFGFPVESVGFPVDVELPRDVPVDDVARDFDRFV